MRHRAMSAESLHPLLIIFSSSEGTTCAQQGSPTTATPCDQYLPSGSKPPSAKRFVRVFGQPSSALSVSYLAIRDRPRGWYDLAIVLREAGGFAGTKRFAVRRKLGAGAMGSVYQALDRETGSDVAIKVLSHVE